MKIKFIFLFALFYFAMNQCIGQTLNLVCNGQYFDYSNNIREVRVDGVVIKVGSKTVRVVNALDFSSQNSEFYETVMYTDESIKFKLKRQTNYFGDLNRYSGKVTISESSDNSTRLLKLFDGECALGGKKF